MLSTATFLITAPSRSLEFPTTSPKFQACQGSHFAFPLCPYSALDWLALQSHDTMLQICSSLAPTDQSIAPGGLDRFAHCRTVLRIEHGILWHQDLVNRCYIYCEYQHRSFVDIIHSLPCLRASMATASHHHVLSPTLPRVESGPRCSVHQYPPCSQLSVVQAQGVLLGKPDATESRCYRRGDLHLRHARGELEQLLDDPAAQLIIKYFILLNV